MERKISSKKLDDGEKEHYTLYKGAFTPSHLLQHSKSTKNHEFSEPNTQVNIILKKQKSTRQKIN